MYNKYENIKNNIGEIYEENYKYINIAKEITKLRLKKCDNEKKRYYQEIINYMKNNIIGVHSSEYMIPENIINNINRVQLFIGYSAADLFCISGLLKEEKNGKNLKIHIPQCNFIVQLKLSKYSFTDDDLFNIVKMNKEENDILNNLDP
jgi:hypothetical protein